MTPRLRPISMVGAPIQALLLHLVRELGLHPERAQPTQAEPDHEWLVPMVPDLVHHEPHARHLAPRLRAGGPLSDGSESRFLAAGRPYLLGLGHAALEEGVDLGDFGLAQHGGNLRELKLEGASSASRRRRWRYI